jgi:Fur family transcriptional regulator, ferric uptake regulator
MQMRAILKNTCLHLSSARKTAMSGDHDDKACDDLIREAGLRITRQRQTIVRILIEADDHPDAEQVLSRARELDSSISQATTYRTLAALSEKGLVRNHTFDCSAARFELAARPHHDHLIDIETGRIVEFVSAEIERLQREVAAAHGYEIIAHRLELFCRKTG